MSVELDDYGMQMVYECPLCLGDDFPGHECLTDEEFEAFKCHYERLDREACL